MQYKVTRQYSSGSEALCAEFRELNDAKLFIDHIEPIDAALSIKTRYWVFDNNQLANEVNNARSQQSNLQSQYADAVILPTIKEPFNIIIHDSANAEVTIAKFTNIKDAKIFAEAKVQCDSDHGIDVTYYIFDCDKFIEQYDKNTTEQAGTKKESSKVFR